MEESMDDIRKERLLISICTLAGISCIIQNYFGRWEFWVPAVVLAGITALWIIHITHRIDSNYRIDIYFAFAAFLLFYHGIHETSLFDISVSIALFMVTFTLADRLSLLNMILAEYVIVMVIQFRFLLQNRQVDLDAFGIMRIVYHIVTVLTMYVFSRITINRRIAEKERMREWLETVENNDRDMEDFLSNISHELRTPVNVISGMTAILQKENDSSELDNIRDAGIRLAHQIEDIQDYTEIKRNEIILEEENYMCISLINDVVANCRALDREKKLELVVDIAPETPTLLKGDIQKLHKLFRHLLGNAIKFTSGGGVCIKVFPVWQKYGINLTIEVSDTGVGMTRADMSRVSGGMYQANKKRDRSTGGIGIGLPIVYGITHKMGGFVNIRSEKGKGTTVRISIPQQVVDPTPCLAIRDELKDDVIFYIRLEKFGVPEVRDFYRHMAFNLATSLKAKFYFASERRELEKLIEGINAGFIFTGEEEYKKERDLFEDLAQKGCNIIVYSDNAEGLKKSGSIIVMPKPFYGFSVVRILNGEYENHLGDEDKGKPVFDGVKALIVDDEIMNLVVASGLLKDYKMVTDTANSGAEAVEKYENGDYDVIFMDHMMPEMDGVECARRIRHIADSTFRKPVIIALTANALSGAKEMFMREGFDGFIAKPINIGEFERVMKNAMPEEMISYEGRDE